MTAIPNAGRWRLFLDPLFITKWSSVPGEYELILTAAADFAEDHLTRQQEKQVIGRGCGSSLAHRSKQDGAHHRESQESRENASSWAPCWPFVGILRPWQVQEFIHVLAVAIYPVFPLACPSRESWRAAQHPHIRRSNQRPRNRLERTSGARLEPERITRCITQLISSPGPKPEAKAYRIQPDLSAAAAFRRKSLNPSPA
jgi:hypothetical protein